MTNHTDDLVRIAVRQLADEARRTPNLAAQALRRGRRVRRRRRLVATAAGLVAAAALVAPFVLLRPQPAAQLADPGPTASAKPNPSTSLGPTPGRNWASAPLSLPGGWVVTGATGTGYPAATAYGLDRRASRYRKVNTYPELWTAPQGQIAAVFDENRHRQTGLLDLHTGRVKWIETGAHIMWPQWSPDGSRLVLTVNDKETGSTAIGVLTAAGSYRTFPIDTKKYFCTDYCFFTWGPDGREVAFQQTDPALPRSESAPHPRRGVQFFSAEDGRPTRFTAVRGDPAGPWSWSPDGRHVVLKGQDGPQLVEVATGRVIRQLPADNAVWVDDEHLLYRLPTGSSPMVLADLEGRELARQPLPAELRNLQVSIAPR